MYARYCLKILILCSIFMTGEVCSRELKLEDATGWAVKVDGYPQRIISLNPSATETVYALGGGNRIIAVTAFCRYPDEVKSKDKIGTVLDPNIEKIISLRPDLVLATKEGNRKKPIEKLRKAGIKVFVFDSIYRLNDIYEMLRASGKLLGEEEKSEELILKMKERVETVQEKVKNRPRVKVFWQYGIEPTITANKNTLANEIIELSGGVNIARNALLRYPRYSLEEVAIQNPQVIILTAMGNEGKEALAKWRQFKSIKAVKEERIYIIDSDIVCNLGPRLIEGLEEVARALHPEAFK